MVIGHSKMTAERIAREKSFHDERFKKRPWRNRMLSAVTHLMTQNVLDVVYNTVRPYCKKSDILDYGCAQGEASLILRRYGADNVIGIDISDVAVSQAAERAAKEGVSDVSFRAMNAEDLQFEDALFDVIFGIGILHHLDQSRSYSEIARVLKPDGVAVFLEPLGHNPLVNLMRYLTPSARTPDEHPMTAEDLRLLSVYFDNVQMQFMNLTTLFAAPLGGLPGSRLINRLLVALDCGIFYLCPWLQRFSWNVVLTLKKPKQVF